MASSVTVYLPSHGYTYTFSGVIPVQHEFSLKLQTDSESVSGSDYINGARNRPDKVVLSVVEVFRLRNTKQPAVKLGSMLFPVLGGVPVFMPVRFEVRPGDACLETGEVEDARCSVVGRQVTYSCAVRTAEGTAAVFYEF